MSEALVQDTLLKVSCIDPLGEECLEMLTDVCTKIHFYYRLSKDLGPPEHHF
jgi:hypothetical protein